LLIIEHTSWNYLRLMMLFLSSATKNKTDL